MPTPIDIAELGSVPKFKAGTWYIVARRPSAYAFQRVEARLRTPVPVTDGKYATGYYRNFVVRAASADQARDFIAFDVMQDDALVFDDGTVECVGSEAEEELDGILECSGRVYFTR